MAGCCAPGGREVWPSPYLGAMADEPTSRIDALAGDVIDYDELFRTFRSAAGTDDRELALVAGLSSMMLVRDGGDGARFAP